MHLLDLVIVGIVAWFTFTAFSAGLIREFVRIVAVIVGAVLAGHLYGDLAANIDFLIDDDTTRSLVSFVAIFAGIVVLGQVAAMVLRNVASMLMLGPFDRLGGAAFGFAKGMLLVEVLLIASTVFPVSAGLRDALQQSALAPFFLDRVPVVLRLLPGEFSDALDTIGEAAPQL